MPKTPPPRGRGRPKGSKNRITREFAAIIDSVLCDEPAVTVDRLVALRDSDEPADRKTFWGLVGRRLPLAVNAKVEAGATVRIIDLTGGQNGALPSRRKELAVPPPKAAPPTNPEPPGHYDRFGEEAPQPPPQPVAAQPEEPPAVMIRRPADLEDDYLQTEAIWD